MDCSKKVVNFMVAAKGTSYGYLIEAFTLFDNKEHLDSFSLELMERRFKVTLGYCKDSYKMDMETVFNCYYHVFKRCPTNELKEKIKSYWK